SQPITFTATVNVAGAGQGTPSGTVDFIIDGATVQPGVALDVNGRATYTTSTLSVAGSPHSVTVSYASNSANFTNSSGTLAGGQMVSKDAVTTIVTSSPNPSVFGQAVTFTAVVAAAAPGTAVPIGSV